VDFRASSLTLLYCICVLGALAFHSFAKQQEEETGVVAGLD